MPNDAGTFNWEKLRQQILDFNNSELGKSILPLSRLHRDAATRMLLSNIRRDQARRPSGGTFTTNSEKDPAKTPVYVGTDLSSKEDMSVTFRQSKKQLWPIRIVESLLLTRTVADWSDCRSPSRAQRRAKRGFPQRVRYHEVPRTDVIVIDGVMHMHPELARQLRARVRKIGDELDRDLMDQMLGELR